jgi:hypothetical protein
MKKVTRRILNILFLTLLVVLSTSSCVTTSRQKKSCDKQDAKKVADIEKEYHQNVEIHNKNQSKETQKMIKQNEKESKKLNKSRKVKLKKC